MSSHFTASHTYKSILVAVLQQHSAVPLHIRSHAYIVTCNRPPLPTCLTPYPPRYKKICYVLCLCLQFLEQMVDHRGPA